jgi:hypothetical protein
VINLSPNNAAPVVTVSFVNRFNHGAGLPLAAMTIADQLCLSAYFCWMVVFSEWGLSITFDATTKTVICKVRHEKGRTEF